MRKLYIMCGLPYSGKTTLQKELVKRLGFQAVSVDRIMDEKDMWREGHPTQEDWNAAYSEAYRQMKEHLKEGKTVIFDCANLPFHERENARKIADGLEAVPNEPTESPEEMRQAWTKRVEQGTVYLWELEDGQVVSLAAKTRPVSKVISIGPVYTPPEQRGKGYASRCVAALSQLLLDSGWERCSLFTDLANPTSNSIYQQIGYWPICNFNTYWFV